MRGNQFEVAAFSKPIAGHGDVNRHTIAAAFSELPPTLVCGMPTYPVLYRQHMTIFKAAA
jgi:hypothetical protein